MEKIKKSRFTALLRSFDFRTLFNELGWDHFSNELPIAVQETTIVLQGVAQKKGFAIFLCEPLHDGSLPLRHFRQLLEKKTAKHHFEHLIIYTDTKKSQQVWQLTVKEENKPRQVKEVAWYNHQDAEVLFQRLRNLLFTLDEEDTISIVDVTQRVSENFAINTEKVTKKFYTEFKKQHGAFLNFIEGMDDHIEATENANKQWYASLMLNRLMFCYFIQKKGFLDQDIHYLKNKLELSKGQSGIDNFYSFYRSFLLELFHDGLGKPMSQRHGGLRISLGRIPYLNGGLFDVHELEHQFESISISDEAFQNLFDFFDNWNWHLDSRYQATGKDINPDVIGYIFEKYINDRADMGAYYTKEDITDYIGKNTIIPFLIDETQRRSQKQLGSIAELWHFLKQSGDTYIYDAVKYGILQNQDLFGDLPEDVQAGFNPKLADELVNEECSFHLWQIREAWNQKAPKDIALPTETFRELIARRQRYSEVKHIIESGHINSINDFVTYNLNIRQFLQDFLETTQDAHFIRNFYKSLEKITILDPTVGSGAFLFAAMNILEPLYEVCLERMEQLISEEPSTRQLFKDELDRANSERHPDLRYFIYKSIILNNLYGVDIMNEAVEIAKLRLFLKLVATVNVNLKKDNYGLEPLPDIDFNIRAGNSLVGFASENELLQTIRKQEGMFYEDKLNEFMEEIELVSLSYQRFQDSQLVNDQGNKGFRIAKIELNERLRVLNHKLNLYLANNYGIEPDKKSGLYQTWLESHQPFHWFAEFYQIIAADKGFSVVIGNPPYLEMRQIGYDVIGYRTRESNAVHSMCVERSMSILKDDGAISMIVPMALVSTQRMGLVQNILEDKRVVWYSNFAWRPAKLFDQVNRALTIFCSLRGVEQEAYSTGYKKWNAEHRDYLFPSVFYSNYSVPRNSFWFPKTSSSGEINILEKLLSQNGSISEFIGSSSNRVYYRTTGGLYWKVFTNFSPKFLLEGVPGKSSRETSFSIIGSENSAQIVGLLSSNTFWWWYTLTSNLRDLNPSDINGFRFEKELINGNQLLELSNDYLRDLNANSHMLQRVQKNKGITKTQSFKISKSKPIINEIDTLIARHHHFTEEELDFIINYDIKYRMGDALNEGG